LAPLQALRQLSSPPPDPEINILVAYGFLDSVYLLLISALIFHGAFLCFLQCVSSQGSPPGVDSSPSKRSVSGTFSPKEAAQEKGSASSLAIVSFCAFVFSFSFSYFFFHCSAVSSKFTEAVFLMVFDSLATDLCPNIRVDLVSASL
uniref:Uncharacterized protein n=1 Tax=Vombatus ursinus TaxID=29139 RepID=A0A4X2M990_VOMUR